MFFYRSHHVFLNDFFSTIADCSNAGDGELTADIKHNGVPVPVTKVNEGRGIYRINFTPRGSGLYTISVFLAGMQVAGQCNTLIKYKYIK